MKINFAAIKISTLDGTDIPELHTAISNIIWRLCDDIAIADLCKDLYQWNTVEITLAQLEKIKSILYWDKNPLEPFVTREIKRYFDDLK